MVVLNLIKEHIFIIAPAIALLALLVWWLGKKGIVGAKNFAYTQKNDPNAQKMYDEGRQTEKPLTMKERLELSWQFLYDITDIVLSRFSQADQEAALGLGKTLLENGGHYEHVIDYGIKHNLGTAQNKGGGMTKSA